MKYLKTNLKRASALLLAAVMTGSVVTSALAAEAVAPTADETYYATLDYYGDLEKGSVVKTYKPYGRSVIKDYGKYDRVTNLTDDREGRLTGDGVTFDLEGDVPARFYFEAESSQPFEDLPWHISLSYRLNGVPTAAEKLAGEKGVVDIMLDVTPNGNATEYSRTNLILTAASMFNGDDILSLEAEGAQVQLIGNLYCVLFAVLPGEGQHFVIKVGTEDFSYAGMIFLAVPATVAQLEQVATLREVKEKAEESLEKVSDSLDIMLNTLEGMGDSLSRSADGLDALDKARRTISSGKDAVYNDLDKAVDASDRLTAALDPLPGHVSSLHKALDEIVELLNEMNDTVNDLSPEADNARKVLKNLKSTLSEMEDLAKELEDQNVTGKGRQITASLKKDFDALGKSVDALNAMAGGLSGIGDQLTAIDSTDNKYVTIQGMTVAQIEAYVSNANTLYQAYQASGMTDAVTFAQFMTGYFQGQGMDQASAAAQAGQLETLWQMSRQPGFDDTIAQAKKLNDTLMQMDMTVNQLKQLVAVAGEEAGPVIAALSGIGQSLGSKQLSGDLSDLCDMLSDIFGEASGHDGMLTDVSDDFKTACAIGERLCSSIDDILGQLDDLNGIINSYRTSAQKALEEAEELAKAASEGMSALSRAVSTTEKLLKSSGNDLDTGMQKTLSGLSSVLRQASVGLGQTDTVRDAKTTVETLIEEQWDEHTGQIDNLLLIDGKAAPQSITDSRNGNVTSLQYIMRTHEITKDSAEKNEEAASHTEKTTFWQRIGNMFQDMWNAVTGIFKR